MLGWQIGYAAACRAAKGDSTSPPSSLYDDSMQKRYAIWLMPSGAAYKKFRSRILKLSRDYETVDFEPHITLVGDINENKKSIMSSIAKIVPSLKPFYVELTGVGDSENRYKCIFIRVRKSGNIMSLNRSLRKSLKVDDATYEPHLSLMYGNLKRDTRKGILKKLPAYGNMSFRVGAVHLMATDRHPAKEMKIFSFR